MQRRRRGRYGFGQILAGDRGAGSATGRVTTGLPVSARFIAAVGGAVLGIVVQAGDGAGRSDRPVEVAAALAIFIRLDGEFEFEGGGFGAPDAPLAAFGSDHFVDKFEFKEADGLEGLEVGGA